MVGKFLWHCYRHDRSVISQIFKMTNHFILVFLKYKHQLIQIVSLASFAGISLFCSFHEAAVNILRYAARYQKTLRNKMTRKTLLIISFLKQTTHVKYPFFMVIVYFSFYTKRFWRRIWIKRRKKISESLDRRDNCFRTRPQIYGVLKGPK